MRNVKVGRTLNTPLSIVWAVLADYPNIADWNDGVKNSYAIGDATQGVGAQRKTELVPDGKMTMRETVSVWDHEERMVIAIDEIVKMPVKHATMTFTLSGTDTTSFKMNYAYVPKGGPLAILYGAMLDKQFGKGFNGFIDSLELEAQARAAT
jgi:hypothetical protein